MHRVHRNGVVIHRRKHVLTDSECGLGYFDGINSGKGQGVEAARNSLIKCGLFLTRIKALPYIDGAFSE